MTNFFRLFVGLIIMIFPAVLGWYFRSPAVILILGVLYVPFYFFGKMKTWAVVGYTPTRSTLVKAIPVTFAIQVVLVAVFYLIGRGLGTFFADHEMAPALTSRDAVCIFGFLAVTATLALVTYFAEHRAAPTPTINYREEQNGTASVTPLKTGDDDAFGIDERTITTDTFFRGRHFSDRNATAIAIKDIVDYDGTKPKRVPKRASAAMIAQAEDRLGVRLPDTLRDLYRTQNGGTLYTYYVPRTPDAPKTDDNWVTAFADDYNELRPLAQLEILQANYDEYFNPDFDTDEDKAHWISGADKLVIIAARTGYGTALDYRQGPEPGVLLYDHGNSPGEIEILKFESFDSFFANLREVKFDHVPNGRETKPTAYGGPFASDNPESFWAVGNAGAAVTQDDWADAGEALGVTLPEDLFSLYKVCNGGTTRFVVTQTDSVQETSVRVFPTRPGHELGLLLPIAQFVTLATLSDRIEFVDNRTPWRDLFSSPEELIVISAAFDMAILLDYTVGPDPAVLVVPDLDNPASAISFSTVATFLISLRRFGIEEHDMRTAIGDPDISVRQADAATFWTLHPDRAPVSDRIQDAFIENWGLQNHGLPTGIEAIYKIQNGGMVRFRFAPPQYTNPYGHINNDPTAQKLVDIFPDGLLAMEFWQPFAAWRNTHGLATQQSLFDFTDRVQEPYDGDVSSTELNLFVIGDHSSRSDRMVTVLDLSTGPFVRNRNLMTLKHDSAADKFETVFGPMMIDNIHSGLFGTVRAYKSEL